jgi:hypothetical protein
MFDSLGKVLILVGIFIVVLGLIATFWDHIPLLGKLPGDISFNKGVFRFLFPLAIGIIISVILTIVVNVVIRLFR